MFINFFCRQILQILVYFFCKNCNPTWKRSSPFFPSNFPLSNLRSNPSSFLEICLKVQPPPPLAEIAEIEGENAHYGFIPDSISSVILKSQKFLWHIWNSTHITKGFLTSTTLWIQYGPMQIMLFTVNIVNGNRLYVNVNGTPACSW